MKKCIKIESDTNHNKNKEVTIKLAHTKVVRKKQRQKTFKEHLRKVNVT